MINSFTCPVCQNLCSSEAISCPKCGHPFSRQQGSSAIPEPLNHGVNKWKVLTIVAGIFALVLIGVAAYTLFFRANQNLKQNTNSLSRVGNFPINSLENGTLLVDAAVIFKSGDVKPVARTEFSLINKNFEEILRESDYTSELPPKIKNAFTQLEQGESGNRTKLFALLLLNSLKEEGRDAEAIVRLQVTVGKALKAAEPFTLYTAKTDFQGKARFDNVKPGKYFLFGCNKLGNSAAVWNVQVDINGGENKITLDQNNASIN